jgi:hypothetical protein
MCGGGGCKGETAKVACDRDAVTCSQIQHRRWLMMGQGGPSRRIGYDDVGKAGMLSFIKRHCDITFALLLLLRLRVLWKQRRTLRSAAPMPFELACGQPLHSRAMHGTASSMLPRLSDVRGVANILVHLLEHTSAGSESRSHDETGGVGCNFPGKGGQGDLFNHNAQFAAQENR